MEDSFILVLTTVANEQQAGELARSMVDAGLAACVQIQAIRSIYRWKGEVCDEPEQRLTIKTLGRRYAELERHIKANHAYATPEIVQVQITGGSREYLGWMEECIGAEPTGTL